MKVAINIGFAMLCILGVLACNQGNESAPSTKASIEGYTSVKQGNYNKLSSTHPSGGLLEEGFERNGAKEGTWLKYDKEGNLIGITSFMNGKLNGPSIVMNNRGQIIKKQYFVNDVPNGLYGEYKFGRALKEVNYIEGQMDGLYQEFYNDGKLQRSITYANGVMNGPMKYYNEDGEVTLEYTYKDGEKVGEGILKK